MSLCNAISIVAIDRLTGATFTVDTDEWDYANELNDIGEGSITVADHCATVHDYVPWCTQIAFMSGDEVLWQGWTVAADVDSTGFTLDLVGTIGLLGRATWKTSGTLAGEAGVVVELILQELHNLTGYRITSLPVADVPATQVSVPYKAGDTLLDTLNAMTSSSLWYWGLGDSLIIGDPTDTVQRGNTCYGVNDFADGLSEEIDGVNLSTEVVVLYGEDQAVVVSPPDGTSLGAFPACPGRLSTTLTFDEVTSGQDAQRLADFYAGLLSAPIVTFDGDDWDFTSAPCSQLQLGYWDQLKGPTAQQLAQLSGVEVEGSGNLVTEVNLTHSTSSARILAAL